jgi:hypothetical protein
MVRNVYCRSASEHADVLQQQAIMLQATIHHREDSHFRQNRQSFRTLFDYTYVCSGGVTNAEQFNTVRQKAEVNISVLTTDTGNSCTYRAGKDLLVHYSLFRREDAPQPYLQTKKNKWN